MIAGAPFPDLYDWTWGELKQFVECKYEARKEELRQQANMYFRTASLIARMCMGSDKNEYRIMDEYSWLWTKEERDKAFVEELMHKFDGKCIN